MTIGPLWAPVVAALGASTLTVGGGLGITRYQELLRRRSAARTAMEDAGSRLLTHSQGLVLRARSLGIAARFRTGMAEGLDIVMHIRRPIEVTDIHEWLDKDYGPAQLASAQLRLGAPPRLVEAADRLLGECAAVISVAISIEPPAGLLARLRQQQWSAEDEQRVQSAAEKLGVAWREVARLLRSELGVGPLPPAPADIGTPATTASAAQSERGAGRG